MQIILPPEVDLPMDENDEASLASDGSLNEEDMWTELGLDLLEL